MLGTALPPSHALGHFDVFSHVVCHVLYYQHLPLCDFPFYHEKIKLNVLCVHLFMHQCYTFIFWYFRAQFVKYECDLVRENSHPVVQYCIINL